MDGFLLQDWTTIRLVGATASAYQSEEDWFDVSAYSEIVFWTETSNILLGGGTQVRIELETSPTKDESLFLPMTSLALVPSAAPTITKILEGSAPVLPQAWIRWKLRAIGSPPNEWGATFRVHAAAPRRRAG